MSFLKELKGDPQLTLSRIVSHGSMERMKALHRRVRWKREEEWCIGMIPGMFDVFVKDLQLNHGKQLRADSTIA